MKIRRLSIETLEHRRVLAAGGIEGPAWESVIVSLNDNVGNPRAVGQGAVNAHGGQLGHVYEHSIRGFSAQLPQAAITALAKNPQVKSIEADLAMRAFGQVIPTGIDRINADLNAIAKINGVDGTVGSGERVNVNIAIIDSGIDGNHPDLNVVGGRRFYTVTSGPPKNRGSFEDGNFADDNGHGSHVAGTAAALDNGIGVVGVAPGARLWAVKVLDSNASGYVSDIIAGIDWVTRTRTDTDPNNDIEVANMSLGGQGVSTAYHNAIKSSVGKGVVYVVASGNEYRDIIGTDFDFGTSDDTIPAVYPEVATISAIADTDGKPGSLGSNTQYADYFGTYVDDTFADFSNYSNSTVINNVRTSYYFSNNKVTSPGLGIDLMMPGVDIYSTYKNGGYATMSGTSMASPHAAGLAALYIAQHGRANNATGVYAIRQALIDGGKAWTSPEGLKLPNPVTPNPDSPDNHIENLGWAGPSGPVDQPPTVNVTAPVIGATVAGSVTVTANASDDLGVTRVEFFIGVTSIGIDTNGTDGWAANWNTTNYSDGAYNVTAKATDTIGQTSSHAVNVTVDNIDSVPSIAIASPTNGATVSGSVTVIASASDDRGVAQVEFLVGGISIGVDTNGTDGWSVVWNTLNTTDGARVLTARAMDTGGQTASSSVSVTVANAAPATMHVGDLDASSTNEGKNWTAFVTITVHDTAENPVAGAGVSGTWSGGVSGNVTLTTNSQGIATVLKSQIGKNNGVVTFTVTNISGSLQYNSGGNHDPDSDSNGTSINVNKPLQVAASSTDNRPVGSLLNQSMVRPAADLAIEYWAMVGVATDRLAALRKVDVEIADLSGSLLGMAYSDWIVLDRDAAGFGWSTSPTVPASKDAAGIDLVSALTHEFGHLLGFDDDDSELDVMAANLEVGSRRLSLSTSLSASGGVILNHVALAARRDINDRQEFSLMANDPIVKRPPPSPISNDSQRGSEASLLPTRSDDAERLIDEGLLALLAQGGK